MLEYFKQIFFDADSRENTMHLKLARNAGRTACSRGD